ncbi:MAG: DUF5916 domain-containing protein [Balneolaceae bacterium]
MSNRDIKADFILIVMVFFLGGLTTTILGKDPVLIPTVEKEVRIDGIPNDPIWASARVLPLRMSQPVYGREPTGITKLKMVFSDEALYVAGVFSGSPGQSPRQLARDDLDYSSDMFALVIDGYNDGENAYVFMTSPSGNKTDLAISNDAESPKNMNWDTFWTVKVHSGDSQWSFEMRIPLSSLQYQRQNGKAAIGLSAWKYVAANNEFDTYPLISNEYGIDGYFKPSKTADFYFSTTETDRPLFVSPYLLSGYDDQTIKSGNQNKDLLLDAGLDAKYKLSSNFTLDATVNTDFAQVESDDQKINLSRFDLYRDEKRAFFQERAGLFSFNTGGSTTLFYSRRIGLTDDGQQVPLYGGLRLTGRTSGWDLGMLTMQSAPKYGLDSQNFGVLRIRKSFSESSSSYIGFMSASRIAHNGSYNIGYGVDMVWEAPNDVFFTGRYAHTLSDPKKEDYSRHWLNSTNVFFSVERRSYVGLFYTLSINRVGQFYNPEMGFQDRRNCIRYGDKVAYGWIASESSIFQKYSIIADGNIFMGNTTNELESSLFSIKSYTSLKSGFTLEIGAQHRSEQIYEGFSLSSDVTIPKGNYHFWETFLSLSSAEGQAIRFISHTSMGAFFDGKGVAVSFSPEWTVSSKFQLSSDLEYYNIRFTDRDQHYRSLLVRGRLDFKPTSRISLSGLSQYNNLTKIWSSFARFRFNIMDGADLFLVYKHGRNSSPLDQVAPNDFTGLHSIRAKFNYTFQY